MNRNELGLHLLSEHGVGVFSLGKFDDHIHRALHHPSQKADHVHHSDGTVEIIGGAAALIVVEGEFGDLGL